MSVIDPESVVRPPFDDGIEQHLQLGRIAIALLIVCFGGWAALTTISGAVIATGTIVVETNARTVQHMDGGMIGEIHVQNGDLVRTGETLISLQEADVREELSGVLLQLDARKDEVTLVAREYQSLLPLKQKQLVTESRMLGLEREKTRLEGEVGRLTAEKARLEAQLARSQITAPIQGYVHNLAVHTQGGVVAPGASLLEIVPSFDTLLIEARVSPADVDQLVVGQEATIRLSALDLRKTPEIKGTLKHISADLIEEPATSARYFIARLTYDGDTLKDKIGVTLTPGMPADVFIKTGNRTVLGYFLKPLTDQIVLAFRED